MEPKLGRIRDERMPILKHLNETLANIKYPNSMREIFSPQNESSSIDAIRSYLLFFVPGNPPQLFWDGWGCYVTKEGCVDPTSEKMNMGQIFFWMGKKWVSFLLLVTEWSVISLYRRLICGPNTIDVEITPIWKLLIKEVINAFLWCWIETNKFCSSQTIKNATHS